MPQILHSHPLLGLGLNNFSLYYQAATGKTNWGPHSFYVSLIVETGSRRDGAVRRVPVLGVRAAAGRARASATRSRRRHDPLAARVRPLAWGWTAALAGTMAANIFYLTMSFYYFFVFLALALAVPLVFGGQRGTRPAPRHRPRDPRPQRRARGRTALGRAVSSA